MKVALQIGDPVEVRPARAEVYRRQYGPAHAWLWVTFVDEVQGRRRLHVNGAPWLIWAGDARKRRKLKRARPRRLSRLGRPSVKSVAQPRRSP